MSHFIEWSDALRVGIDEIDSQHKVDSGKTAIGFELLHFLKIWLTKRIMESDPQFGQYFLERGVNPKSRKRSWAGRLWDHLHL
jgi:hemerythrin